MELTALKEIPQIKRRINELAKELKDFDGLSTMCLKEIGGGGRGSSDGRMVSILEDRDYIRKSIETAYKKYIKSLDESMRIIEEIDEVKVRNVFTARYINEMTWNQVAQAVGGQATSDSVKKIHDRYLKTK